VRNKLGSKVLNMEEIKFISEENGVRIDAWISSRLEDYSRSYIQKLLNDGLVLVNGSLVKSNYKVKVNDDITVQIFQ
jgi:23S rRNA pseudouridine1911/1915/1917 synthase